jgi:beta-glucosidase
VRPRWLRESVEELRPLGRPIYVTENGLASRDDGARVEYLRAVLGELWEAIQAGADVRGYFHWSSHDNFEWAHGYSMRFGLIAVDLASQERTVKPSGELFGRIAAANALPPND